MPYKPGAARPAGAEPPPHAETVLRTDGTRIKLRLWRDAQGPACRIEYLRRGEPLLRYEADSRGALRTLRGRAVSYAFRSIEQLRYDFERDLEAMTRGDQAPA